MKVLLSVLVFSFTLAANAAQITSATYDGRTDEIVVKVIYGGCALETFKPTYGACMETYPAQITVTLDDTQDRCKGLIPGTVRVPAPEGCRPAYVSVKTARGGRATDSVFVPETME